MLTSATILEIQTQNSYYITTVGGTKNSGIFSWFEVDWIGQTLNMFLQKKETTEYRKNKRITWMLQRFEFIRNMQCQFNGDVLFFCRSTYKIVGSLLWNRLLKTNCKLFTDRREVWYLQILWFKSQFRAKFCWRSGEKVVSRRKVTYCLEFYKTFHRGLQYSSVSFTINSRTALARWVID